MTEYKPNCCLHPGAFLKDDLKTLHISISKAAKLTGITPKRLRDIIRGKESIYLMDARKFEELTGEPAYFWMNSQEKWNDWQKAKETQRVGQ